MKLLRWWRKSLTVLLLVIVLVFVFANISTWVGRVTLNDNEVQALQLAVALIGIFWSGHYELERLERRLREERKKEVQQQRLKLLDDTENWVEDVSSTFEKIAIFDERLRDVFDERLKGWDSHSPISPDEIESVVSPKEIESVREQLVTLEIRAEIARERLRDTDDELARKISLMRARLDERRYMLSLRVFPVSDWVIPEIARVRQAIDKARKRELERD